MQMDAFKKARASCELPERIGIQDSTDACQMHALKRTAMVHVVTGFSRFNGLDIELISRSINDGRDMAFTVFAVFKKHIPGFENAFVAGTAANLGVRVSRFIDGDFVFTADMMKAGVRQKDAIGRAVGWDHPVRYKGERAWGVQALRGDSFDVPYACLLPRRVEGLIMGAGRSVSAQNPSLLRVMAHTMVVGQGAGTAAAIAAKRGIAPRKLDAADIRAEIYAQGGA